MRILLVEDDALLGDALQVGLREQGFAVEWIRDGAAGEAALASDEFTAIVLDLGLPRMSGLELLQRVRNRGDHTPVIILTAREAVDDRVRGLDLGADDYVVKPVALKELAARLRAVARRAQGIASGSIIVGSLSLDLASRAVTFEGNPVELQPREFALLQELVLRAGRVVTRTQLETQLYEWDCSLDSNAIEVHVHHLRRKLAPKLIRTVRGVGYMIPRED
ncbi:MAG: response regulator [Steroidobacteraceae bacterium]|jgi:two-component system OmpR family response regulator/two-component system response regulator QseB|nr:response regulator [Steroidobacteraceae bacterium]